MEISKSDWKLFAEKLAGWQENYITRLNREYIAMLSSEEGNPSERFWELDARIKKDRRHPGVILEKRKSHAIFDIADLIRLQVITIEDLDGFSEELKEKVRLLLERLD